MVKVVSYTGSITTYRTLGSSTHNLFTIENQTGSGVLVGIRRLLIQLDATVVLLNGIMPIIRTSRASGMPSGGTILPKGIFNVEETSDDLVVLRGATASDQGAATAITATSTATMWQQYAMRLNSAHGQVIAPDNPLVPTLSDNTPVVLDENTALAVQVVVTSTTSTNPSTNHWFVQCVWEEFTDV
jgi:hypothetical protein